MQKTQKKKRNDNTPRPNLEGEIPSRREKAGARSEKELLAVLATGIL